MGGSRRHSWSGGPRPTFLHTNVNSASSGHSANAHPVTRPRTESIDSTGEAARAKEALAAQRQRELEQQKRARDLEFDAQVARAMRRQLVQQRTLSSCEFHHAGWADTVHYGEARPPKGFFSSLFGTSEPELAPPPKGGACRALVLQWLSDMARRADRRNFSDARQEEIVAGLFRSDLDVQRLEGWMRQQDAILAGLQLPHVDTHGKAVFDFARHPEETLNNIAAFIIAQQEAMMTWAADNGAKFVGGRPVRINEVTGLEQQLQQLAPPGGTLLAYVRADGAESSHGVGFAFTPNPSGGGQVAYFDPNHGVRTYQTVAHFLDSLEFNLRHDELNLYNRFLVVFPFVVG